MKEANLISDTIVGKVSIQQAMLGGPIALPVHGSKGTLHFNTQFLVAVTSSGVQESLPPKVAVAVLVVVVVAGATSGESTTHSR